MENCSIVPTDEKKRHWCDWINDALSTPFFPNQLMRLLKKRRIQCTNVEIFGFNRWHTRKNNTSAIAVACLMTLFSLYSSKWQLMRLLKKRRMQCLNVKSFGFNRCHTRKSNTSAITVACLMTLFSLSSSKLQLMRLLKKRIMQCSNVEKLILVSIVAIHEKATPLSFLWFA